MSMFCFQCQETAKGTGCTLRGVCGKKEETAKLQDALIYTLKKLSKEVIDNQHDIKSISNINREVLNSLFMTITNANFDDETLYNQIIKMKNFICYLSKEEEKVYSKEDLYKLSEAHGVISEENEDIRSLCELVTYGLKGMAAYAEHACHLGKEDGEIYTFIYTALAKISAKQKNKDELLNLVLETGSYGVKAMALLDDANTHHFGNPEITSVNIGVKNLPAILISGHDLKDLEELLIQTQSTGVDVYTHSEMLPAHYYPEFKKYKNLVGNYGNAWYLQTTEFKSFNGPVLFTTNCIVPPRDEEVRGRIFTTNSAGFPGCKHIKEDENGKKDFSEIINLAKTLPPPSEIENGTIVGGFAHNQVLSIADKIVEAITSGKIKQFIVMAGCDGRMKEREYYTQFAKNLPKDSVILTAGCAKYRYNKLNLGEIDGIPRVLDAGQCNDSYSLAVIALKLKEIFKLEDLNELPITFNIAWYEQKAVIVLLALLYLGFKNIHIGPTLPRFLSPNVLKILAEEFGLSERI